jgi:stage II sporulation protein AA (anti-sigma F factor antagonist)
VLLTVVTSSDDTEIEIALTGELDHSNADVLRQHVLSALARLPRQVVIDMSGLTFMDSAGIGEIIRANRLLTSRERGLVIRGANPSVTRLLEMMGIHLIVRLEPGHTSTARST